MPSGAVMALADRRHAGRSAALTASAREGKTCVPDPGEHPVSDGEVWGGGTSVTPRLRSLTAVLLFILFFGSRTPFVLCRAVP